MDTAQASSAPTTAEVEAVLKALTKEEYTWRTLKGIATDSGLPAERVLEVIKSKSGKIIDTFSKDGEPIFALRSHYIKKQSGWRRIFAAIRNKIT
jgi:hypothetical protein